MVALMKKICIINIVLRVMIFYSELLEKSILVRKPMQLLTTTAPCHIQPILMQYFIVLLFTTLLFTIIIRFLRIHNHLVMRKTPYRMHTFGTNKSPERFGDI